MDPREAGPQLRKSHASTLMLAKSRASMGEKVNFCPYGCDVKGLDENGYCDHVVGFTVPGDKTKFERFLPPDRHGRRVVDGAQIQPVLPTDHLEWITVSARVYRDKEPEKLPTPSKGKP